MLRWLTVLAVLSLLTGLLAFGIIPTSATGLAWLLFLAFSGLLALSLVVGIIRGG
jgi:uncharacterized membrane protein YtjA (UPF0391 family)